MNTVALIGSVAFLGVVVGVYWMFLRAERRYCSTIAGDED